jgi:hypothetical protein
VIDADKEYTKWSLVTDSGTINDIDKDASDEESYNDFLPSFRDEDVDGGNGWIEAQP